MYEREEKERKEIGEGEGQCVTPLLETLRIIELCKDINYNQKQLFPVHRGDIVQPRWAFQPLQALSNPL